MNREEQRLMSLYGITQSSKTTFSYRQHKFDNIKDAINFAVNERKLELK